MLTEKQKKCPYCHVDSDIRSIYGASAWNAGELRFSLIANDPKVQNDGVLRFDLDFNPEYHLLTAWGEGVNLSVDIAYCPMCGRPLG